MLFFTNLVDFWELFFGAFDKYVEVLYYFHRFASIQKPFEAFLTNFGNNTEILCYFWCYFLKNPKFGGFPKIRQPATPLIGGGSVFNSSNY